MKVGSYPYVCTFPGHGLLMHGVFRVSSEIPKEVGETGIEPQRIKFMAEIPKPEGVVIHRTFMPDSSPAAIAVSLLTDYLLLDAGRAIPLRMERRIHSQKR